AATRRAPRWTRAGSSRGGADRTWGGLSHGDTRRPAADPRRGPLFSAASASNVAFLIGCRLAPERARRSVAGGRTHKVPSSLPPTGGAHWARGSRLLPFLGHASRGRT